MLHSAAERKKKKKNQNICIIIHSLNQSGMTFERLRKKKKKDVLYLQVYPFNPRTRMILETGRMVLETDIPAFGDQTPSS